MANLGVTGHPSDAARKDVKFLGKIKFTEGGDMQAGRFFLIVSGDC